MKKWQCLSFLAVLIVNVSLAQNFESTDQEMTYKIEKAISRYGNGTRIYVTDPRTRTFNIGAGERFVVFFAYDLNDKVKRRMMAYQTGEHGEKLKNLYPNVSNVYRDGNLQVFTIRGTAPSDQGPNVKYTVDANPSSTVYFYKVTPGVSN